MWDPLFFLVISNHILENFDWKLSENGDRILLLALINTLVSVVYNLINQTSVQWWDGWSQEYKKRAKRTIPLAPLGENRRLETHRITRFPSLISH